MCLHATDLAIPLALTHFPHPCPLRWLQTPTIVVLNLSLLGCAALITSLVFATDTPPDVVPHLVVVLFFACGLLGSVNW